MGPGTGFLLLTARESSTCGLGQVRVQMLKCISNRAWPIAAVLVFPSISGVRLAPVPFVLTESSFLSTTDVGSWQGITNCHILLYSCLLLFQQHHRACVDVEKAVFQLRPPLGLMKCDTS